MTGTRPILGRPHSPIFINVAAPGNLTMSQGPRCKCQSSMVFLGTPVSSTAQHAPRGRYATSVSTLQTRKPSLWSAIYAICCGLLLAGTAFRGNAVVASCPASKPHHHTGVPSVFTTTLQQAACTRLAASAQVHCRKVSRDDNCQGLYRQ